MTLSVINTTIGKSPLNLDAPKLTKLKKITFGNILLVHPESVLFYYGSVYSYDICKFINLEYLINDYLYFGEDILNYLKKLKEIHFNSDSWTLENLRIQKRKYLLSKLKFYYLEVDSDVFNSIEDLNESIRNRANFGNIIDEETIEFYSEHHLNLSNPFYFLNTINYNQLSESNLDLIGFISKLNNLKELKLNDGHFIIDEFFNLLKLIKYLKILNVTRSMNQDFYNQIPNYCSVIEKLIIKNKNELDLNFIFNFKDIQHLETNQQLTIEFINKIYNRFKSLNSVNFYFRGREVNILISTKVFTLKIEEFRLTFHKLDDLFKYLDLNFNELIFKRDDGLNNFIFHSLNLNSNKL